MPKPTASARIWLQRCLLLIIVGLLLGGCGRPDSDTAAAFTPSATSLMLPESAGAAASITAAPPVATATIAPLPTTLPATPTEAEATASGEAAELAAFALKLPRGTIGLRMSVEQVTAVLGEPVEKTTARGVGSPEWRYADGITIVYGFGADGAPGPVWSIIAHAPFAGSTVGGLRLGDSEAQARAMYQQFAIETFANPRQLQIEALPADRIGLLMHVAFDDQGKVQFISFDDNTFN